jgi:glyoxylase-like metal-dependent hydrolase (beta-lactamase superfamily II)
MKPWVRNSAVALSGIAVAVGAAYYWLIVESRMPAHTQYALNMPQIRRLAASMPGEKPTAVEVERIALFRFPATAVVAGDGWRTSDLPVYSYRIAYPSTSIIVDTALSKELGGDNLLKFDAEAYARMQKAMSQASVILITHEHVDHIGGLTSHPGLSALMHAVQLNRQQFLHPEAMAPAKFPEHALDGYAPIEYENYRAVAPGIVLIKAPGHTPGSQMVFVATEDGKELLFIGDVAWHFRNIAVQRERARLVTWLFLGEDRDAVFGELAALGRLHAAEPAIRIVPGHDGVVVDALIADGSLKSGFTSSSE